MLSLRAYPVLPTSARSPVARWIALTLLGLALALFAPPASAQPSPSALERALPAVRLTVVRGRVDVMPAGGRAFAPALADSPLARGARVRTGDDGRAELTLSDGVTLALDPQSLLVVYGNASPAAPGVAPSTTTTLQRGTLRLTAPPASTAESVPVATQALTVFPGRADATVSAELGGHITALAVTRGRLRVRFGSNEYVLPAGRAVREEEGRPPARLRPLPRAPQWRRPPSTRAISFGEPVDVEGTFGPGPRVAGVAVTGYRVDIARDASFRDRLGEQRLGPRETQLRFRSLNPGTWYVRLFALDPERFESPPSSVARIEIAAPRVEPGELPTATRAGRRAALVIPQGFHCSLDGSQWMPADRPHPLDPARPYALRCGTTPDGRDARATTLTADQVGPLVHTVALTPPNAAAGSPTAAGALSLDLRDAEGRPVSLAAVEVTAAEPGVVIEGLREVEPRGRYTAGLRLPLTTRQLRLRFTINHALTLEETLDVPEVVVAAPAPTARVAPPPTVQVQVIRAAQPFHHPEDDEVPTDEDE
ncbi:MAG: FecR domain-containing protein [Deltaproteobacteria bacterium]|nr:FecR domain-containing protein [Myxococcales bacterium]MDP3217871.1 FecR domain-containing protein [Deltaproteobacteria bacterium]